MYIYKIDYQNILYGGNRKTNILIVGYAGAGKSFLSKKYQKTHVVINADEIIRTFLKIDDSAFDIYQTNIPDSLLNIKNKFIESVKMITDNKSFVIEGQLKNVHLIKEIYGNESKFQIIVVKPKNVKSYIKNLKSRFESDPANYGRLGFLENSDISNGKQGLNDYIKNGIKGKIINELINKVAGERFYKHDELEKYYKNHFSNVSVCKS
jgi:hypothetical protein